MEAGAVTMMGFWTMNGYSVGFLIGVAVVLVRSILGGNKGSGTVLSDGSFEDACYGNLEGVWPGEGNVVVSHV